MLFAGSPRIGISAIVARTMPKGVRILVLGAEGGRIEVLGRVDTGVWRYRLIVHDHTAMFLDESDLQPTTSKTRWLDTWRQAIKALDSHLWCYLTPLSVDFRFRRRIRVSVRYRLPASRKREWWKWSRVLGKKEYETSREDR